MLYLNFNLIRESKEDLEILKNKQTKNNNNIKRRVRNLVKVRDS